MNTNSCKPTKHSTHTDPIVVVGGGWSGLACAISLIKQGYKVCLLESARYTGGRARTIHFQNRQELLLDNGQHIMLGAYHHTLKIFRSIGLKETEILKRQPVKLSLLSPEHPPVQLKTAPLPAPFHLLTGLLTITGLSLKERLQAVSFALLLALHGFKLKQDISVQQLLARYKQPEILIAALWEPLCLATMNTPIRYASASVFLTVLKDSFRHKRTDSDLLFFRHDLSNLFCNPAVKFIESHGSTIHCASKVTEIIKTDNVSSPSGFEVVSPQGSFFSSTVILATPAAITDKLLKKSPQLKPETAPSPYLPASSSTVFNYEPITTVYLQYPDTIPLTSTMTGFFHTKAQWAINRSICHQQGLVAVVISGPGQHTSLSTEQLAKQTHEELALCIKDLPLPLSHKVIIEKKATFSCRVGINQQRPSNQTSIPGLFLAGDYTDTQYPATLEGAVKSGVQAAVLADKYNQGLRS